MADDILASGRATHEQNPQAVSAVPVGIPDALAQLEYLIEHLAEAEGSRDADCGYVTGKHFQMMTMCPDPDGLAAAINSLPTILSALRHPRPRALVGEPVAWVYERVTEIRCGAQIVTAERWTQYDQDSWSETPLYTADMLERLAAKAIEARSDETQGSAPGESAVTNGHSPESAAHE